MAPERCGNEPNHPLAFSPLRSTLVTFIFLLAFGWNVGLGLRAEVRVAAWTEPGDNSTRYRREHYSTWHTVSCPAWDDCCEGSGQPVQCTVKWFSRPGMATQLIGYLMATAAGCVWLCQCKCCLCSSASNMCTDLQKPTALVVFFGGFLLMVGWIAVLTDKSLEDVIPADALPLPNGSEAEFGEHQHFRWWYGMLCGPFFWIYGALIWFYRGDSTGDVAPLEMKA